MDMAFVSWFIKNSCTQVQILNLSNTAFGYYSKRRKKTKTLYFKTVIGVLSLMGVPFLLFSYGGSSTITAMLGIGLVLAIRIRKFPVSKEAIALK
jgi:hypothetical protein